MFHLVVRGQRHLVAATYLRCRKYPNDSHGLLHLPTPRCLLSCQVIPIRHANALSGVPRIAAVFQNDCLYIAHHMITLGHEFRQGLPPPINQTATMIDTVPLFRELAAQR